MNHGLRGPESEADEAFVADLAASLGVPFGMERVDPASLREGEPSRSRPTPQEAARRVRRAALSRIAARLACYRIATGHHADDQAETVLMRLLRGCGPDSLGGIGETSPDGTTIRPLLGVSRSELEAYAARHGLAWREDPSNRDPRYTRSRMRADLLPGLVRDWNPRLLRAIGDLAEAQRRETEWVDGMVRAEAARVFTPRADGAVAIAAAGWRERPEALSRRLVKHALLECGGGRDLSRTHLMRVLGFLRGGRTGARIELPGGICVCRESAATFVLQRASDA